jgi:hypothetical protein
MKQYKREVHNNMYRSSRDPGTSIAHFPNEPIAYGRGTSVSLFPD